MAGLPTLDKPTHTATSPSAVVWINGREAIVARMSAEGAVSTCEIERGPLTEEAFLATVVRAIGDRERVLILGPSSTRLALEREYVAIYHRPERLIDVEPEGRIDLAELLARVRSLAS